MRKTASALRALTVSTLASTVWACGSSTPPPPPPAVAPPPPAPTGPTRTDFRTIARKLIARCVGGGWINKWRADHPDIDVARARVFLEEFTDKTKQDLDPTYLNSVLAQRMRISGTFDVVDDREQADFIGRGELLRLAERDSKGRYSVYTAILKMENPTTGRTVHSCETSVQGEM